MLPKGVHEKMDSIRSKNFWQGAGDDFKYHMAKWISICKPKTHGGLGIINTYLMNQCLITKWIWKIEKGSNELWCRLVRSKYLKRHNFHGSSQQGSSQFWKSLHKVKHLFHWGAEYKVHMGDSVRFWHDTWFGEMPLKIQYKLVFEICQYPNAKVCDFWKDGVWDIPLRRNLHGSVLNEWQELQDALHVVGLDRSGNDEVNWVLDKSRVFSTRSLYDYLNRGGVRDKLCDILWKCKVPLKIKVFLWQIFHRKLQTALALSKRGWHGGPLCCVCNKVETIDHIFFECVFAQYV
jgi:hypothetical protein